MAVAFARTIRSLDAADFRGPRLVWGIALLLLAAWLAWFLGARVAQYQVSESALSNGGAYIIASFPPSRLSPIYVGQPGRFQTPQGVFPAQVSKVEDLGDGHVYVELGSSDLLPRMQGTVEIEVARRSPAGLLFGGADSLVRAGSSDAADSRGATKQGARATQ